MAGSDQVSAPSRRHCGGLDERQRKREGQSRRASSERGLTAEDVQSHAFLMNLPAIERIDLLALTPDQRRDAPLHEIVHKRAGLANRIRIATVEILDADEAKVR